MFRLSVENTSTLTNRHPNFFFSIYATLNLSTHTHTHTISFRKRLYKRKRAVFMASPTIIRIFLALEAINELQRTFIKELAELVEALSNYLFINTFCDSFLYYKRQRIWTNYSFIKKCFLLTSIKPFRHIHNKTENFSKISDYFTIEPFWVHLLFIYN